MVKAPPPPLEGIQSPSIANRRQFRSPAVIRIDRPPAYYHSGDCGDIIYSLLWVKHRGGGAFYVGPDTTWETNAKQNPDIFKWLLPLLEAQPYIKKAEYAESKPECVTHDLNAFRELWMDTGTRHRHRLTRLFEAYPKRFVDHVKLPENEPWLEVEGVELPGYPVVIHRSPRYRNPDFPWFEVARRYGGKMIFVGHKWEYDEWIKSYGELAEYLPVTDALEMARVIAGAKLFIGNQSFPMSLALALNRPLMQETGTFEPDCIFDRGNAQYFCKGPFKWPKFGRRFVTPIPDPNGFYELGPCENAFGIGDTLTITPLIRELKGKAILNLPLSMDRIAPLFANICPVRFTDDYPVFRHYSEGGKWHMAEYKLRMFGKWPADILPVIEITEEEKEWAEGMLERYRNPIAFCPTCAPKWAHIRQFSPEFWKDYIEALTLKFTVLQFGLRDIRLIGDARDFRRFSIREAAALYSVIKTYIGVDTGDTHMMLGVGGSTITIIPHEQKFYRPNEWSYQCDRAKYFYVEEHEKIEDAIQDLLLKS